MLSWHPWVTIRLAGSDNLSSLEGILHGIVSTTNFIGQISLGSQGVRSLPNLPYFLKTKLKDLYSIWKQGKNKQTNKQQKKTRVKFCSLLPVIYTDIHVAIFMKVLIWLNSQFQDCFDCSSWLITPIGKMSSGLVGLLILKKPCSLPLWITFQLKPVSDFAFKEPDVRRQLFLLVLKVNPYPTHRYPQSS